MGLASGDREYARASLNKGFTFLTLAFVPFPAAPWFADDGGYCMVLFSSLMPDSICGVTFLSISFKTFSLIVKLWYWPTDSSLSSPLPVSCIYFVISFELIFKGMEGSLMY